MVLAMTVLAFGTPRKLPKPNRLDGRVVVLDVAFAGTGGGGFDKVTRKFLDGLGDRLAMWVDHHDHERHADFRSDRRFVLAKKSEHGACPEMISPELVQRAGTVDSIVCHTDFDGLASAAKWLRGGQEPYPGCDDDARCIDTRTGVPSELAQTCDRALRARPRDEKLLRLLVSFLEQGATAEGMLCRLQEAAEELIPIERETHRAARQYVRYPRRQGGGVALVNVEKGFGTVDKTELLLEGQKLEGISIVVDQHNVSVAAAFDSGINFLEILGLDGGMPTRVSVSRSRLNDVLDRLGVDAVA